MAQEITSEQITVREVTHMQPSWIETQRGSPGDFTLQLVLDNGVDEYLLHLTVDDIEEVLRLRDRTGNMFFDTERKVLMFGNLPAAR
jgi:hypothetical protein